jgi:hypothetical protein
MGLKVVRCEGVDKVHLTSCDYETKLCVALKAKDFLNNGAVIRFSRPVLRGVSYEDKHYSLTARRS